MEMFANPEQYSISIKFEFLDMKNTKTSDKQA